MQKLKFMLVLVAGLAAVATPAFAQADGTPAPAQADATQASGKVSTTGLVGGTVKVEYLYTDGADVTEYTVLPKVAIDSDVEIPDVQMKFGKGKPWKFCITMDISDTKIKISDIYLLWNNQESHNGRLTPINFNGFVLQFKNILPITSVTINPETTLGAATADDGPSFTQKGITFTKDQITINWANARTAKDAILSLDVTTGAAAPVR